MEAGAPPAKPGQPHPPGPGDMRLDTGHPAFDARVNHRLNQLLLLHQPDPAR